MPEVIPRIVLVEGDPILGMDAVFDLKRKWSASDSIQWVEMIPPPKKVPGEFLNSLDGELATSDIGGERKIVFLRGLLGTKVFKDGLYKVMQGVSPNNTLLAFDEDGVIRSDIRSKQQAGWGMLREQFVKHGEVISVPLPFLELGEIPWGAKFGTDHVKAVVAEMGKRGKKISPQTTREVFLELVMHEWSFILKELDRLAELVDGDAVSSKDVLSVVFPWSQKHAIFEFCEAFSGGNFNAAMQCYDDLNDCKIPPEVTYSYCTKLLHWQLIAAHLASYGQPLPSSLDAIGALMSREVAVAKTAKMKMLKPRLFKEPKSDEENDEKDGISSFTSKAVSRFVKDVFSRRVAIREGKLGTLPFMQLAMTRYLTMINAMEDFRLCGDRHRARGIFRHAMQKICWK